MRMKLLRMSSKQVQYFEEFLYIGLVRVRGFFGIDSNDSSGGLVRQDDGDRQASL